MDGDLIRSMITCEMVTKLLTKGAETPYEQTSVNVEAGCWRR